jgi:hypothetical protein
MDTRPEAPTRAWQAHVVTVCGDNHLLLASQQPQPALEVQFTEITCVYPLVGGERLGALQGAIAVLRRNVWAADEQLPIRGDTQLIARSGRPERAEVNQPRALGGGRSNLRHREVLAKRDAESVIVLAKRRRAGGRGAERLVDSIKAHSSAQARQDLLLVGAQRLDCLTTQDRLCPPIACTQRVPLVGVEGPLQCPLQCLPDLRWPEEESRSGVKQGKRQLLGASQKVLVEPLTRARQCPQPRSPTFANEP